MLRKDGHLIYAFWELTPHTLPISGPKILGLLITKPSMGGRGGVGHRGARITRKRKDLYLIKINV
jgi:hypothetical protein